MASPTPQEQAQAILDHEVIPSTDQDPAISFKRQVTEDVEFEDTPHAQAENVLKALEAIAAGTASAQDKIRFEKGALPVVEAYAQKFVDQRTAARQRATGEAAIEELGGTNEKQQVESGGQVGHWSVAKSNMKGLETKVRDLASTMGINLQEADRSV